MDRFDKVEDSKTIAKEAREWLIRLDGDEEPGADEKASLQAWVAQSETHRQELARISAFWDEASVLTELSIPLQNEAQNRRAVSGQGFANRYVGALSVLCVLSVLLLGFNAYKHSVNAATNGIYTTNIGELQAHTLADGSVLRLNTNSQVEVSFNSRARNIRLLRGEAHFDVSHNRRWSFHVYAGLGRVKAVGTAFGVRLVDDRVKVIVSDGKVDLAVPIDVKRGVPASERGPAVLQSIGQLDRGQEASFDSRVEVVEGSGGSSIGSVQNLNINSLPEAELGRQLAWRDGFLVFNALPLSQVVKELNRYTSLNIKILDDELNTLKIGGRFKISEMDAMFDVFESSFGITVSRVDEKNIHLKK